MYNPSIFDPVNLFTNQFVAASTTSSPSPRLETSRMSKVQVTVKNTGPSSDATVLIYAVNTATGGIPWVIRPFTLGAGSDESPYFAGCYITPGAIPTHIYAKIVNGDPLPEYPEIVVNVPIPDGSTIDAALVESLMAEALSAGTLQAQERASKQELRAAIKPLLEVYEPGTV